MTTAEEHEVANVTPADLDALEQRLAEVERYLHVDERRGRAEELERLSAESGFWDDAEAARKTMAEIGRAHV